MTTVNFTVYRVHPVESFLYGLRGTLSTGLVTGFLSGFWNIAKLRYPWRDAIGITFNALGANLRHSHVWLSYGPLEKILISPAQHQIHHSNHPEHFDKNFGICLSIWDILGKSWVPSGRERTFEFGLDDASPTPAHGLLRTLWAFSSTLQRQNSP